VSLGRLHDELICLSMFCYDLYSYLIKDPLPAQTYPLFNFATACCKIGCLNVLASCATTEHYSIVRKLWLWSKFYW